MNDDQDDQICDVVVIPCIELFFDVNTYWCNKKFQDREWLQQDPIVNSEPQYVGVAIKWI